MRISDWSSDVCSSDLSRVIAGLAFHFEQEHGRIPSDFRCKAGPCHASARDHHIEILHRAGATSFRKASIRASASRRTRSEEHTSELQSLMRISYAVFCLKKKKKS